jgi:hypothetical protein
METNHDELATNAITVECVKTQRENHYAPAVVAKYKQSNVQYDWRISVVRINGVECSEWFAALGLPTNALQVADQPFKTKKSALEEAVYRFTMLLEYATPEWDWQDETDCPEYFAVIAALKAGK